MLADEGEGVGVTRWGRLRFATPAEAFVGEGEGGETASRAEEGLGGVDVVVDLVSYLAGEAEERG